MYSFIKGDHKEHKKAKDINKNVVKEINHKEYINMLSKKTNKA